MPHPLSLLLLLLLLPPSSTSLSFTFPSFNSSTPQFIQFQNDSFDKIIKLTKNELGSSLSYSVGHAVYRDPLPLWDAASGDLADFTTQFTFIIQALNPFNFGDGLTFFLSPFPSSVPPNSTGGNLGLVNSTTPTNSSSNFVAVEFDTFMNSWDPSEDHVGIDINSVESVATVVWKSSLKDGRIGNAWINYNASTKNLSVFLTYQDNSSFTGESTLSHIVDLRDVLPETVAIGFSAATGQLVEIHNILSWEFSSTLKSVEERNRKKRAGLGVGVSIGIGLVLLVVGLAWFLLGGED